MEKPHHPPDLYDYVPAQRIVTEKEELESDLGRQALMLDAQNTVGKTISLKLVNFCPVVLLDRAFRRFSKNFLMCLLLSKQ